MAEKIIRDNRNLKVCIPRLAIYGFGIASIFWYFWCWIGLTIGVIYFLFIKDTAWKRNGIILACYIGLITLIIHLNLRGVGVWYPPLNLAIWYGVGFILSYFFFLLFLEIGKRKSIKIRKTIENLNTNFKGLSKKNAIPLKAILILFPIVSWTVININLNVIIDNNTRLLWIHAPSKVDLGEEFDLTIEAWDNYERLSATFMGTVEFSIESYSSSEYSRLASIDANLPSSYTFTGQVFGNDIAFEIKDGKDNGLHVFKASINTPGIHYVLVKDSYTGNTYYSNPILVKDFSSTEKLIAWGDLHTHSQYSDGTGTPEQCLYYSKNIARIEFHALTDHGEIMLFQPGALDNIERAINNAYVPGEFVSFQGIEWTNVKTGHYTCVFSGDTLLKNPVLSYLTVPTTDDLWNALDDFTEQNNVQALALPHHLTKKTYPQDWSLINPKYVKIGEVCSVHGDFLFEYHNELNYRGHIAEAPEPLNGSSFVDALMMGIKITMYAASDGHDGYPGHSISHTDAYIGHQRPFSTWHTRNEHHFTGGLTAAYVDNLTRSGVFDGIVNERIFANSDHGRPILEFTINDQGIGDGSTLKVNNKYSQRQLKILIAQDGAPAGLKYQGASFPASGNVDWSANLEIIKNGALWKSIPINNPITEINVIDNEPITGASFENQCIEVNGQYYMNSYSDTPIDPTTLNTGGFDFYLIRVVGNNGRHSYIGPIWVEYQY